MSVINWTGHGRATRVNNFRGSYLRLPAFEVTGLSWIGASQIVRQYNYTVSGRFVLLNRPQKPSGVNYGLCIRYRVGNTVYRYKLWEDDDFVLSDTAAPLYTGQVIKANFVLEIWSFRDATEASQDTAIDMTSSIRSVITSLSERSAQSLATGTAFSNLGNTNAAIGTSIISANRIGWYDMQQTYVASGSNLSYIVDMDNPGTVINRLTPSGITPTVDTSINNLSTANFAKFSGAGTGFLGSNRIVPLLSTIYVYMKLSPNMGFDCVPLKLESGGSDDGTVLVSTSTMSWITGGKTVTRSGPTSNTWGLFMFRTGNLQIPAIGVDTYEIDLANGNAVYDQPLFTYLKLMLSDGVNISEGGIAEVVLYNALHGNSELAQMQQYFYNKYHTASDTFIALPLTFDEGGPWLDNS